MGYANAFIGTVQEEFYSVVFRKKRYTSIEQMQVDLDQWLLYYNDQRTHSGKYCYGKTPMQTFTESIHLAKEKRIDEQSQNQFIYNGSKQTETGAAEEQPARDILTDGNNKAVDKPTAFNQLFLSHMP